MDIDLAEPRTISDATEILANPDEYRDRPTLMHLARLVLMSRGGGIPRQTGERAGRPTVVRTIAREAP